MQQRHVDRLGRDIAVVPRQGVRHAGELHAVRGRAVGGGKRHLQRSAAAAQPVHRDHGVAGGGRLIGSERHRGKAHMAGREVIVDDGQHRVRQADGRAAGNGRKHQVHRLVRLHRRAVDDRDGEGAAGHALIERQRAARRGEVDAIGRRAVGAGIEHRDDAVRAIGARHRDRGRAAILIHGEGG